MAFGTVLTYEFRDHPAAELKETQWRWRVSFLRNGYTGEPKTITPTDKPLRISTDGSGDNIFSPIIAQKYTFSLLVEDHWNASDLYVKEDQELQVLIEYSKFLDGDNNWSTYRTGWVQPTDLKEDYTPKPYPVEVSACCGLSTLKNRPMLDLNGKRLKGIVSHSYLLRSALFWTGLEYNMYSGVNLYQVQDVSQGQTIGGMVDTKRDPLFTTGAYAEAYLKDDGQPLSCYDALKKVLESMECKIAQLTVGFWYVLRVSEMAGGWDVGTGATATSLRVHGHYRADPAEGPVEGFNKAIELGVLVDTVAGKVRAKEKGQYWLQGVKPGVRLEQTFGKRLSNFVNGDMATVDGTGLPTGWQVRNMQDRFRYRTGTGTDADPFRLVIKGAGDEKFDPNSTPYVWTYLDNATDSDDYLKFQKRRLKGRARLTHARAAKIIVIFERDDAPYLYTDNDFIRFDKVKKAQAVAKLVYNVHKETVYANKTFEKDVTNVGIFDIDLDLGTVDHVKRIIVGFGMPEALDLYDSNGKYQGPDVTDESQCEYFPFSLEIEQEGAVLDGMQQTIVRPGKTVKDASLVISLGDVPAAGRPIPRTGTTLRTSALPTQVPTSLWFRPDADPSAPGHGITGGDNRLGWLTKAYARQAMVPAPTMDVDLIGRLEYGPLAVLRFFDLPDFGAGVLTRWEYNVQDVEQSVTSQRLMSDVDVSALPLPYKEWQTPTGTIPQNVGEDGTPVGPTTSQTDPNGDLIKKLHDLGVLKPTLGTIVNQPGFTAISGKATIGANVYNNNQLLGTLLSQLRKSALTKWPL